MWQAESKSIKHDVWMFLLFSVVVIVSLLSDGVSGVNNGVLQGPDLGSESLANRNETSLVRRYRDTNLVWTSLVFIYNLADVTVCVVKMRNTHTHTPSHQRDCR